MILKHDYRKAPKNTLRVFIIRRAILDSKINYGYSIKSPLLQAFLTF